MSLGFEIELPESQEAAVARVEDTLKSEGFGVLTRIDVKATLKEKLDAEFRPYVILGACNPPLARRALEANPAVGLMLPCNVTVERAPGGGSLVRIVDPEAMMGVGELGGNAAMQAVAAEAREKLARVAERLRS
jgi:uncharacterized protein (DUF302 family)